MQLGSQTRSPPATRCRQGFHPEHLLRLALLLRCWLACRQWPSLRFEGAFLKNYSFFLLSKMSPCHMRPSSPSVKPLGLALVSPSCHARSRRTGVPPGFKCPSMPQPSCQTTHLTPFIPQVGSSVQICPTKHVTSAKQHNPCPAIVPVSVRVVPITAHLSSATKDPVSVRVTPFM